MTKRASIRDVALKAGVSVGSVSRVLNRSGYVSKDLRAAVLAAVDKLGYEPDFTARHMRTGHSKTIGYLLANIANPFLASHLSEVERHMQAAGYSLLVGASDRPMRDRELIAFFENRRLEGIIASPSCEYASPADCPFTQCSLPVVIVDRELSHPFDRVIHDHQTGIRQAMDFLLSLGHRRIALFASTPTLRPGREKLIGYQLALEAAGLPFDDSLVYLSHTGMESSHLRMAQMLALEKPPTAIIALGTRMLSGAIRVARQAGLEIPKDLSVIAMGTQEALELMYPPATMLRYNFERSAQFAVQLMMDRIHGTAGAQPQQIIVNWDLIVGASCSRLIVE